MPTKPDEGRREHAGREAAGPAPKERLDTEADSRNAAYQPLDHAYYETGATQPDLDMFRRLAILFEVSTDDLLGLSTPMLDMEDQLFLYVASLPLIKRRSLLYRLQSFLQHK